MKEHLEMYLIHVMEVFKQDDTRATQNVIDLCLLTTQCLEVSIKRIL